MYKLFLTIIVLLGVVRADVISQPASLELLAKQTPVVDIRTPAEWRETGLLKGAIPIMFFDERGNYNVEAFMKELNAKVDTSKPFALICRSGSRTSMVSDFLSKNFGYSVINLQGGMLYVKSHNLPVVPYTGQ